MNNDNLGFTCYHAPTHPIKAIAFDLDGTLVDSLPDLAAAVNATRTHFKLPKLSIETIQSYIGDGALALITRSFLNTDIHVDIALPVFMAFYTHHVAVLTHCYSGVLATLDALAKRQIPMALITNKPEALAVTVVEKLKISHYFSHLLGGDSLKEKKPSPQPLLHTAKAMDIAPQHWMMVGDSRPDIKSAKAADAYAVGVNWGYQPMPVIVTEAIAPDAVLDHMPALLDLLDSWSLNN